MRSDIGFWKERGRGSWMQAITRHTLPVVKELSPRDTKYSVLYFIYKSGEVNASSHHKGKIFSICSIST